MAKKKFKKFVVKRLSHTLFLIPLFLFIAVFVFGTTIFAKEQKENNSPVCARHNTQEIACHARVVVDPKGNPKAATTPSGYGPAQFRGAYNLTGVSAASGSSLPVIAVVAAYNHPNIKSDLDRYSSAFGIPTLPNCSGVIKSSPVPCFQKLDQRGGTAYPSTNAGWALEIAMDVEVAHAVCQNCKILLVEADSNSYANLMAAVDQAVAQGATVISNSYGSSEFSGETSYDYHFNRPGVAFTFSSGDYGYGTSYPAASQYVTAVGGTTLRVNADNSYAGETAWAGAGSGCSLYEAKPSWQTDAGCTKRSIADVSAVADPSTGAAVYSSVRYQGKSGWFKVGGTSLSAPLVAGVYALAGYLDSATFGASVPYANVAGLRDITAGSNGSCGGGYLCTSVVGYDGPTGLGTPNGTAGF